MMCPCFFPPGVGKKEISMKAHLQMTLAVGPNSMVEIPKTVVDVFTWRWERYGVCNERQQHAQEIPEEEIKVLPRF